VGGTAAGPLYRVDDGDLRALPEGAVVALPAEYDEEFLGDPTKLSGIAHARVSMTGYPAVVAREVGIPMTSGISLPDIVEDGDVITLDGDRGVVYRGEVTGR